MHCDDGAMLCWITNMCVCVCSYYFLGASAGNNFSIGLVGVMYILNDPENGPL